MVALRAGVTVKFVHRTLTGTDDKGNDVYSAESIDVPGCAVVPGTSTETWQGTEQIEADLTVYAPFSTLVNRPWDEMVYNGDTYNVVGVPRNWASPFTGTQSMLAVVGKLITTGGAAT
jgi:hypothetical protein